MYHVIFYEIRHWKVLYSNLIGGYYLMKIAETIEILFSNREMKNTAFSY